MHNLNPLPVITTAALLILVGCTAGVTSPPATHDDGPEVCCGTEKTLTRQVSVFEDANENGVHDEGDSPLANVLLIVTGNIHGSPLRQVWNTDDQGRAELTLNVTHIFNVDAIAPCGYEASTPVSVNAYLDDAPVSFGFVPRAPQAGEAIVRFHLWHDANQDGVQNQDEPPLSGVFISPTPVDPDALSFSEHQWLSGEHSTPRDHVLETDDQGWAELHLANTCGDLYVWEPEVESYTWKTTSTKPAAVIEATGDFDRLKFTYTVGETVIEWGLTEP